ncbi:agmatinase [Maridesulfovibrio zosterae]|uniref:agmatinase n=1 Tax=Maridesulfovibrio zosterae TaxID=82171 RepID=UPI00041A0CDB|nr:agmatinase [Maridesulfovibrio zosterae]
MEDFFLAGEIPNCAPEKAAIHIISAPLESSVSYGGGTAEGPKAILEASTQLELWNGVSCPGEAGIHTAEVLDCSGGTQKSLNAIEKAVSFSSDCGAIPIVLGGEHTVTLGALRALKKKYGNFGIVQFDAHADLRDSYEGDSFSHACVMRRAVDELGLTVFQLGVRAMCLEEVEFRKEAGIRYIDSRELYLSGIPESLLPDDFPEKIYITFDVDGLDPSVIRATGTPVPGGIGWHDAMSLLELAVQNRCVIGADVVELAPQAGDHASDFAAAQLAYQLTAHCISSAGD